MSNHHTHSKVFFIGTALGGVIGTMAALMLAPKSGTKLRKDLLNTYSDISDKTQDMAHQLSRKGKKLVNNLNCGACDWSDKAKELVDGAKAWLSPEKEEEGSQKEFAIGACLGCALGAVVGLLVAPQSGEDLRQNIVDGYEDTVEKAHSFANQVGKTGKLATKTVKSQANRWLNVVKAVAEELGAEAGEEVEEQTSKLQELAKWASFGMDLWHNFQSKK